MVLAIQEKKKKKSLNQLRNVTCPNISVARIVGALECVCWATEDLLAKWGTMGGVFDWAFALPSGLAHLKQTSA